MSGSSPPKILARTVKEVQSPAGQASEERIENPALPAPFPSRTLAYQTSRAGCLAPLAKGGHFFTQDAATFVLPWRN